MNAVQRVKRYGLTVVATGAALAFASAFGQSSIWFVLAVLISTLYGGVGPGIAAVALSAGILISFVAEPHLPTFLAAALSVVAFAEAKRWADRKERQAEDTRNTRLTVDRFPGMVATLTPKGEPEFFNSRVTDYFGKTSEELRDWAPLVHPEDRDRIVRSWMHSVETGEPFDVEHRALY